MQTLKITMPLFAVEISGDNERDLFPAAAFWLSLPTKCPVCSKPIVLEYTTPKTYKYYKLKCTGAPAHCVNLGQKQIGGDLYFDARKAWELFLPGTDHGDEQTTREHPAAATHGGDRESDAGRAARERDRDGSGDQSIGKRRNDLIKLIAQCKAAGLRCGITPADVGSVPEDKLQAETERVAAILAKGDQ